MHLKGKTFPIILGLSALLVELCAAFFSVYGLSKLFAGASLAVILMAASLETAKVITASFLYRHWKTIHWTMKTYMTAGVVVLVLITSMGIYGFLSNAFQSSTISFEKEGSKSLLYERQISQIESDRNSLLDEKEKLITNRDAALKRLSYSDSTNFLLVNKRQREVEKEYKDEIANVNNQIRSYEIRRDSLSNLLSELKLSMIDTGAEVGPIIFVARLFNVEIGTVVQYLIFIFISVFDPLAIVLVLATNKAWIEMKRDSNDKILVEAPNDNLEKLKSVPDSLITETEIEHSSENQLVNETTQPKNVVIEQSPTHKGHNPEMPEPIL